MKIFQPIASYLLAALVAVVHVGAPAYANAPVVSRVSNPQPLGASQHTITWEQPAILQVIGQRTLPEVLQTGNKLSDFEQPVGHAQKLVLPVAGVQNDLIYFQSFRFVMTSLEVSTIIFPFHFFW